MTTDSRLEALLGQAGWLRALAMALLHRGPDAEDAVQEVWAAALRSPPDPGRPARPWLAQVLRNVVRSRVRHDRRQEAREAQSPALAGSEAAPADGLLERMQLQRRVAGLVMELEEPYRTTLLLRYYEGRPAVEIARDEGVSDGTIRWRLNEAVRRLRERLDQECGQGRDSWRRALLPLVGYRPRGRVTTLVAAGALTAALVGTGALWVVRAGSSGIASAPPATSLQSTRSPTEQTQARPAPPGPMESEDETMKKERLTQAATLFGVVLPALAAAADQQARTEELVTACIELDEKSYECRDAYAKARAAQVPASKRDQLVAIDIKQMNERAANKGERRRAWCQQRVSGVPANMLEKIKKTLPALRDCYALTDCQERAACLLPHLDVGLEKGKHKPRP